MEDLRRISGGLLKDLWGIFRRYLEALWRIVCTINCWRILRGLSEDHGRIVRGSLEDCESLFGDKVFHEFGKWVNYF